MNNHCTNVPPQRVSNLIRRITIANNGVEATQNALVAVRLREIFDLGGGLQHLGSYPMVFQHSVSQSSRVIQVDTGLFIFICIEAHWKPVLTWT